MSYLCNENYNPTVICNLAYGLVIMFVNRGSWDRIAVELELFTPCNCKYRLLLLLE